jgi:hypothetical protein
MAALFSVIPPWNDKIRIRRLSKCVSKHSNQTKGPFVFCAGNAAHVDSKQSGEKPQWKKYGRHNRQDIHGLVHLLSLRLFVPSSARTAAIAAVAAPASVMFFCT